jgi:hypothetical protein
MAEVFEARLDKLFAEPPAFEDAGVFAGHVQSKLDRNWATRRLVIGALGGIGGLIGVGQIVSSGVVGHMKSLAQGAPSLASIDFSHWHGHLSAGLSPATSGAAWLGMAAIGIALALALSRLIEDL